MDTYSDAFISLKIWSQKVAKPLKAREKVDSRIYGFTEKEMLESLLIPVKLHEPSLKIKIENIELNDEALMLIERFARGLRENLEVTPSRFCSIIARSPIPYRFVPRWLRDLVLRVSAKKVDLNIMDKLDLEIIRWMFLEAIGLRPKTMRSLCIITHDIDSEKGLKRALRLKELEEKYEVESTWFLLTDDYKLDRKIVKRLSENGEIALHGDKHDGWLYNLEREEIVKKLKKSKEKLENIAEKKIVGFRTPLLQYNKEILEALSEAGFVYDSSIPTWEPMHPLTMKPDGIGLISPIKIKGVLEIPVTLLQDHQMLRVLGLTPKQAIKQWIKLMGEVEELGGVSVFLIHPDYEFANKENLEYYENMLNFAQDFSIVKVLCNLFMNLS